MRHTSSTLFAEFTRSGIHPTRTIQLGPSNSDHPTRTIQLGPSNSDSYSRSDPYSRSDSQTPSVLFKGNCPLIVRLPPESRIQIRSSKSTSRIALRLDPSNCCSNRPLNLPFEIASPFPLKIVPSGLSTTYAPSNPLLNPLFKTLPHYS
jgi:hypothetical protein